MLCVKQKKLYPKLIKPGSRKRIQRELKNLHSGIRYEAHLTGSGAIAQGDHAKAVGAGGIPD